MKIAFDILRTKNNVRPYLTLSTICEYRPTNFAVECSLEMEDAREKKMTQLSRLAEFKGKPRKRPSGTKMLER